MGFTFAGEGVVVDDGGVRVPPGAWARDVRVPHAHHGWSVLLPPGVTGEPVRNLTNPELTSAAIYRGWVEEDAMYAGIVTRPRTRPTLRGEVRALTEHFEGGPVIGERAPVPGSVDARLATGFMAIDEGYGEAPEWREKVSLLVCCRDDDDVVLTVRRHPEAALDDVVAAIVASFRLTD